MRTLPGLLLGCATAAALAQAPSPERAAPLIRVTASRTSGRSKNRVPPRMT